ncbi:MAG: hypothetical protein FJ288_02660 [Planctomycetes bacterium]|nr:hypothetical protein [Planctomycetota bacterium]
MNKILACLGPGTRCAFEVSVAPLENPEGEARLSVIPPDGHINTFFGTLADQPLPYTFTVEYEVRPGEFKRMYCNRDSVDAGDGFKVDLEGDGTGWESPRQDLAGGTQRLPARQRCRAGALHPRGRVFLVLGRDAADHRGRQGARPAVNHPGRLTRRG